MHSTDKIYVAGHRGMVGSALMRALRQRGFSNLVTRERSELDLTKEAEAQLFFESERPKYVFVAAAKVGGIFANSTFRVEFLYENLAISVNTIRAAADHGCEKLLFLGSSCMYPKMAPQPLQEHMLLSGYLDPSVEPYATAKLAGLKLCDAYATQYGKNFFTALPTNLYGPGDNFHPKESHVIPAMLRKFHEAKAKGAPCVEIWGTGEAKREFLYIDDMADALLTIMEKWNAPRLINVGSGVDIPIRELALLVREVVGYEGDIQMNPSMPDGPPRKLLDVTELKGLGWEPKVSLRNGLLRAYQWALESGVL